jgi:hypothetical protein
VKKLIGIAKECVLGLQMEVKRKEVKDDTVRTARACSLFYSLQPSKSPFEVGFAEYHGCLL